MIFSGGIGSVALTSNPMYVSSDATMNNLHSNIINESSGGIGSVAHTTNPMYVSANIITSHHTPNPMYSEAGTEGTAA